MRRSEEPAALPRADSLAGRISAEPPPTNTTVVRVGRRHVLVCRPHQGVWGHQAIELTYAFAYARMMGLPLMVIRPKVVPNPALFDVATSEVRILTSRRERFLPRLADALGRWRLTSFIEWRRNVVDASREEMMATLRNRLRDADLDREARSRVRQRMLALKIKRSRTAAKRNAERAGRVTPNYNRRRLLADPLPRALTPAALRRALDQAATFGLDERSELICLHVRERGYKLGAEMQDKGHGWDDSVRNARITTHIAAVDFLVERGFTVIRMGDPTMSPFSHPGVIDLATAAERDPYFQIWCMFRCKFMVCAESGPLSVSYLTDTPTLTVNATDPIGAFPARPDSMYLLKSIVDRLTGDALTPARLLTDDRLRDLRDSARHKFVQNTSDQVLAATQEMLDLVEHGTPESAGQTWYRELVTNTARDLSHLKYVRKHGADRGYMGYGRLARSQADAWFELDGPARRASTAVASS